ncbi:MAG: 3-deoxy-D-manno-octulosonic acid transferase [Rhodospirillaceae bacterium]|nr:3-deoxy-D-manno-octulosonic acid transferase [Rhodospirillaceae bacterium]
MLRGLYAAATALAAPVLDVWLARRLARGKEIAGRTGERKGRATQPRPAGKLIWFHGASVGECLSLLPLIENLAAHCNILITSGTVTSAALLAERLPAGVLHQFVPLDRRAWVNRFLDHWRPDGVVWAESELWPNLLGAIAARKIPAALVNGRLSDRAYDGWRKWPGFARETLAAFTLVLAQSEIDRARFAGLGAHDARVSGNIKLAARPLPVDEAALRALRNMIGDRPCWLAASIHPGEDYVAGAVHHELTPHHPGLLTVIVPRHPARGAEMAAVMAKAGLVSARRAAGEQITPAVQVYIADTMGELGLFYRAVPVVFLGKSLAVGGGQNPAEPAALGCALMLGPDMSNFRDIAAELLAMDAAVQIADGAGLAEAADILLQDPARRSALGAHARAMMARHQGAVAETLRHIAPLLQIG